MEHLRVPAVDRGLEDALRRKLDGKTKPPGSLGRLEALALQAGLIQGRTDPVWARPTLVVFAGDHGLARRGVSPYPAEVTAQMVRNFLAGGAAVNALCRSHGVRLKVVNAGVDADFEPHADLIDRPLGRGTRDALELAAMSEEETLRAIELGRAVAAELAAEGCTVVGFGEMGIGNSSVAALLMARLGGLPIEDCAGRGTGHDDEGLRRKIDILSRVLERHADAVGPLQALAAFGGFEIAALTGAYLGAARARMTILVDGFIASAALLAASRLEPAVLDYCVFSHCSEEKGHARLLALLGGDPLLRLGLRLGEGSGAALAFPLLRAALAVLNDMASFETAGVSARSGA